MDRLYCTTCKESFKNTRCLSIHLKSKKHIYRNQTETKLYKCICGKSYKYNQGLHVHKKKCTGTPSPPTPSPSPPSPPRPRPSPLPPIQLLPSSDIAAIKLEMENAIKAQFEKFLSELEKNRPPTKSTSKRVPICKKLRARIIEKQDNKCNKCSNPFSPFNIHIDHIIGIQFGGPNDEDNLQALYLECHHAKTIKEIKYRKKIKETINQLLEELSST